MSYLLLKYLHIIAAIFLFGFGMGSYLYLIAAKRTGDPRVIAQVAAMIVRFDNWITTPAGVLQLATGYAMAKAAGLSLASGWLLAAVWVFVGVGALWLPVLILQKRMQGLAEQAAARGGSLGEGFARLYRPWFWLGVAGFTGMFFVVWVMTMKAVPW